MRVPSSVWIVEDNRLYRETITEVLDSASGYVAIPFASCEEAIAALESGARPEAVLMDIGLPGLSGVQGARVFQTTAPEIPVIMLTVHQDTDTIFDALCAGASGYLLKTATPEEIVQALDTVREGGAAMDAQIARRVLTLFTRLVPPKPDYGLSEREHEILGLLVEGQSKRMIAETIILSPHTIDGHIRRIYAKLHVNTRGEVVAKALRERIV